MTEKQNSLKRSGSKEQPREKLLRTGLKAMTDAELLAIILGAGSKGVSVLQLGEQLMESAGGDLHNLARMTTEEMSSLHGVGTVKALVVRSALELGRRNRTLPKQNNRIKIENSQVVYELMAPQLLYLQHEEFWIILLNRSNEVLHQVQLSIGGVAGTIADPKLIFKYALDRLASSIILVHNHPSGNVQPSAADKMLTQKVKQAGAFLDINVLDHLILGEGRYYSFADEGSL
ncbi:RadC family protein [Algivirga pacifica]|uniref:DNA repair protein RadC n=1 Tax=Algivirga pacifica TaxID=1162670 RepID=A0ABP9D5L7_9BACT